MSVTEFVLSMLSVAPAALVDYTALAVMLMLPLRLRLGAATQGFVPALALMAALHTWQRPLEVSVAICLACILAARLVQAISLWIGALELGRLRLLGTRAQEF